MFLGCFEDILSARGQRITKNPPFSRRKRGQQVSNDESVKLWQGVPRDFRPSGPHPRENGKMKTQNNLAIATLVVLYLEGIFLSEDRTRQFVIAGALKFYLAGTLG